MMIFSGFIRSPTSAPSPLDWPMYISPMRWAIDGFMYNELHGTYYHVADGINDLSGDSWLDANWDWVGSDYHKWPRLTILLAICLGFHVVFYLGLKVWHLPTKMIAAVQDDK